ncbi:hypothetical protein PVAP13_3KG315802 [Panicum virgatum]|uniref:Uncharacterized protein n=1 Tax=Panicum virgatum TaxID=38727 RepID=A0A8T0V468_PANVG|nr:hypothetical protein PVAP13_3KG315802 [Panicum virgatum]
MEKKPSCRSPIFFYSILLSSFDFDAVMLSWEPTRAAEQIRIKLLLTLNSVWLMQFIRIFEPWHVIGVGSHTRVLEYQARFRGLHGLTGGTWPMASSNNKRPAQQIWV